MAVASPPVKARLLQELMGGYTNRGEKEAMLRILQSCRSKREYDKVLSIVGGFDSVARELGDKGLQFQLVAIQAEIWTRDMALADEAVARRRGATPRSGGQAPPP